MTESDDLLNNLEQKLDQLLERCETLQRDNTDLRARESEWQRERVRLVEKNELARGRVEAMIVRLKALETE
ncbi:TIGR02449 family protein [Marinimicrobium alkaliphilum]|uniref:TIGR02449 family protein n=1 Tax=Marinimicrobium alkaliphilum TaxID=2202654 RepID=UPI000DBA298B|nr:TIGR02449 family protein [Marinimicrobium alkaliphilum]